MNSEPLYLAGRTQDSGVWYFFCCHQVTDDIVNILSTYSAKPSGRNLFCRPKDLRAVTFHFCSNVMQC